jgi:hypothetical protein
MSRLRTRVPGRYERPTEFRAPLGDHAGEAGVRAGYREGVRVRATRARADLAAARMADQMISSGQVAVVDEPRLQPYPLTVEADTHEQLMARRRELATVESSTATAAGAIRLHESVGGGITEAPKDTASGRMVTIDIIRSGWNTSGSRYYPADVLERDVPKVYGKGTQMYIDHPSATEGDDRPERSLQTLAGVFVDEPWAVREDGGGVVMRVTARVFGPWQPLIREAWDTVGVSINGNGRGDYGTAEGREGLVIDQLTFGRSVDFVTMPGAGGRVLGLLESDRPAPVELVTREAGSLGAYVESRIHLGFTEIGDGLYEDGYVNRAERITLSGAIGDALSVFVGRIETDAPQLYQRSRYAGPPDTAGDTVTAEAAAIRTREATVEQSRIALDRALQAAYGGDGGYTWVQDFDPDLGVVWFTAGRMDQPSKTWQQSYITNSGAVTLTGARVEVRARTVYEPVVEPAAGPTYEAARGVETRPWARQILDTAAGFYTKTTTGNPPAGSDGPSVPAITTKESDMGEKSPEVVAREAAEAERDDAIKTSEANRLELARYKAGDAARPVVEQLLAEAGEIPDAVKARVREQFPAAVLPLVESTRVLDDAAFRTQVGAAITREKEYAAALLEAHGSGTVAGNGAPAGAGSGIPAMFGGTTAVTEESTEPDAATREALIQTYVDRGRTREAAEAAVNGRR